MNPHHQLRLDEWFSDEKYLKWIGKPPSPTEARSLVCKKNFDISLMGVSALALDVSRKKHQSKLSGKISSVDIRLLLGASNKSEKSEASDKQTSLTDEQTSPKEKAMDKIIINQENTLNAEILWCLRLVLTHESYNSCNDLAPLFQRIFAGHEVAEHFSLGKIKSRYTILYGIAPELKKMLLHDVNYSSFFSISFDESLNSELQMCQMNTALRFWNEKKGQAETKYSQFLTRPNAAYILT